MTNVIRLDGGPADDEEPSVTGMSALRVITGMDADEFACAVGKVLDWPVPLFVYLAWERDDGNPAPAQALQAARNVALRNPLRPRTSDVSRRRFLGGVIGLDPGRRWPPHSLKPPRQRTQHRGRRACVARQRRDGGRSGDVSRVVPPGVCREDGRRRSLAWRDRPDAAPHGP